MASGDRFKQLTKNVEDLRAKMQQLKVAIDLYIKEGRSVEEINRLISKSLASQNTDYEKLTKSIQLFTNAQEANVAKNEKQGKSVEHLRKQINAISASSDTLRSTNQALYKLLDDVLNPALQQQANINKEVAQTISNENEERKSIVENIKAQIRGLIELNKVDTKAANDAETNARKVEEAQKKAAAQSKGFFEVLAGSFSSQKIASSLGTVLRFVGIYQTLSTVIQAVKTVFVDSVQKFTEFNRALVNLAAIGGEDARKSLERFEKQAFDVAGTSRFTAKEIVGLQTELLKLGFTAEETIDLVAPVAQTAQALGEDVARVALVFGQTINAFGLLSEEATYVGDVLVSAINKSALSFDTFATAIQYIGPLAQNAGLSFQDVSAAMGILSDAGFKASRIGTGLRGILTEIGDTSEGLISVLQDLAEENLTLSDAVELVGKTNAAQLLTLVRNVEVLASAKNEYYEAGVAAKSASIQIDSFSGYVDVLSSSWDGLLTRFGRFLVDSPSISRFFQKLLFVLDNTAGSASFASSAFETLRQSSLLLAKAKITGTDFDAYFTLISKGAQSGQQAYEALREEINRTFAVAKNNARILGDSNLLQQLEEQQRKLNDELRTGREGIIAMANAEREAYLQSLAIQAGRTKAQKEYADQIQSFIDAQKLNKPINLDEVDDTAKRIGDRIDELKDKIKEYGDAQSDLKLVDEAEVQALEEYLLTLGRVVSTEKTRQAERKRIADEENAIEYERLQRQIKYRQQSIKALEDQLAVEKKYAEETNDYRAVQELEIKVLRAREQAYGDLAYNIERSTILTMEQKYALLDSIASIKVSEGDILAAATRIANSFKAAFDGVELEDPQLLSDIQQTFIEEQINNFINEFGESISNEDKARLGEILAGLIYDKAGEQSKKKANKLKDNLKQEIKRLIGEALGAAADSIDEFNDVAYENLKRKFDAEKNLIKDRAQFEQDIVKAQLQSQMISQEEYAVRLEQIKKKEVQKQNKVEKDEFEAQKKRDLQQAQTDLAEAIAKAFLNEILSEPPKTLGVALALSAVSSGIAASRYAAQVSAINKRIFIPRKFAEGGMVYGPSHEQGGIPFTVQGIGGYEMEGGEYIVNKRAAAKYKSILDQINETKFTPKYKFATGGVVSQQDTYMKQLDLLEAIAEATTGTAINTGRPVRAFVSSSDLQNDTNARRIKDRNSNI